MAETHLAARLARPLLRVTGRVAVALAVVLLVLGLAALMAIDPVDAAFTQEDALGNREGSAWPALAVLGVAVGAFALALLMVPLAVVHGVEGRRRRRTETLHAARLAALDSWLMAGQVPGPRHAELKARLRRLLDHADGSQVARHGAAVLAAFCLSLVVLGLVGAALGGLIASDRNWCSDVPDECAFVQGGLAVAGVLVVGGAIVLAVALGGGAAARRAERGAWADFEQAWDDTLRAGAKAGLPAGQVPGSRPALPRPAR